MKKTFKNMLTLAFFFTAPFVHASEKAGGVSCDNLEIDRDGSLNRSVHTSLSRENKYTRHSDFLRFLSLPKNEIIKNSLQSSLLHILTFHAEADFASLPGITKGLVRTTYQARGGFDGKTDLRKLESYEVSIAGKNGAKLICKREVPEGRVKLNNAGSVEFKREWDKLTGYEIPFGPFVSCDVEGALDQVAPQLFTVLREVWNFNNRREIEFEADKKSLSFDEAYKKYTDKKIGRDKEFYLYLNTKGIRSGVYGESLFPINDTLINSDYSTEALLKGDAVLKAKAYLLAGSSECDVILVCQSNSCEFMTVVDLKKRYRDLTGTAE